MDNMKESLLNPVTTFTSSYFIFLPPQISAVALCIGGIVMMAYAEGFAGPNVVGVILSVTAAIGAALYKVNSAKYR